MRHPTFETIMKKNNISNKNVITQRVMRGSKLLGYILAIKSNDPGGFSIAWSLCCKEDNFHRGVGQAIALSRALKEHYIKEDCPYSIQNVYDEFYDRCMKYFKN